MDLDGSLSRNDKSSELEGALDSDPDEGEAAASGIAHASGPASPDPLGDLVSGICHKKLHKMSPKQFFSGFNIHQSTHTHTTTTTFSYSFFTRVHVHKG